MLEQAQYLRRKKTGTKRDCKSVLKENQDMLLPEPKRKKQSDSEPIECSTTHDKDSKKENSNEDDDWPEWVKEGDRGKKLKLRTFKSPIDIYTPPVGSVKKRGEIRVLKIFNRFARVAPALKKWPSVEGYERYNVCKNNRYQDLSPMVLGPVYDENGNLYANNIEDGWQCSKVWPYHVAGYDSPYDSNTGWMKNWCEWSRRGRFSDEARRHRAPKNQAPLEANRNIPLFSYYMGEQMDYLTARKRMYMRWYEDTVVHTDAYKDLKARHMSGINLLLLEFDGLRSDLPEENRDLDEKYLRQLLDDPSRPFGHGLVLACVLLDLPIWRTGPTTSKLEPNI